MWEESSRHGQEEIKCLELSVFLDHQSKEATVTGVEWAEGKVVRKELNGAAVARINGEGILKGLEFYSESKGKHYNFQQILMF